VYQVQPFIVLVAGAILLAGWTWILLLTLMSLAFSAWIKWRIGASAALFGMFIIPNALAFQISALFRIPWGHMINPWILFQTVMDGDFHQHKRLGTAGWMVSPDWAARGRPYHFWRSLIASPRTEGQGI
jgi:hypothetical protein